MGLGQLGLHAQHVDQKAQRAQVVGQAFEQLLRRGAFNVHLGVGQLVHFVPHAQASGGGLIQAQHPQHTAHRRQLPGHRNQQLALRRVTEILIHLPLDLAQAGAQLMHHAAHRASIGGTAIQILHPRFQRLGRITAHGGFDATRQPAHALGLHRLIKRGFVQGGLDVEQAGRHFHRQPSSRHLARAQGRYRGTLQGLAQHHATGEEPLQRLSQGGKLLIQAKQPQAVALRRAAPGLLRLGDASPCLHDPGGINAAQRFVFVVTGGLGVQAVGDAHCGQPFGRLTCGLRPTLGAKEQQILRQPFRHSGITLVHHTQLRQQARTQPFDKGVAPQQPQRLRLEQGSGQLPQRFGVRLGQTSRQRRTQIAERASVSHIRLAHLLQQRGFEGPAQNAGRARASTGIGRQDQPAPGLRPQIGRVNALCPVEGLQLPVTGEQRQRRCLVAGQQAGHEREQRKIRPLDHLDRFQIHIGRMLGQRGHGPLGRQQQRSRRRLPHQRHDTGRLMQLRRRSHQRRVCLSLAAQRLQANIAIAQHAAQ